MGVERRQGTVYQLTLSEWGEETVRPGVPGEGGTGNWGERGAAKAYGV